MWGAEVQEVRQTASSPEVPTAAVDADDWDTPVQGGQVVVSVRGRLKKEVGRGQAGGEDKGRAYGESDAEKSRLYAHCCVGADGIHSMMRRRVRPDTPGWSRV